MAVDMAEFDAAAAEAEAAAASTTPTAPAATDAPTAATTAAQAEATTEAPASVPPSLTKRKFKGGKGFKFGKGKKKGKGKMGSKVLNWFGKKLNKMEDKLEDFEELFPEGQRPPRLDALLNAIRTLLVSNIYVCLVARSS